jgi:hypothetical protein
MIRGMAMATASIDYHITDLNTFKAVTQVDNDKGSRQIAALYFYFMTDCLIDLAYELAVKALGNISRFNDAGGMNGFVPLASLRYEYGNRKGLPDKAQRDEIYLQVFGVHEDHPSNEHSEFVRLRNDLIDAAVKLMEAGKDSPVPVLREHMRGAHNYFWRFLDELHGDALKWSLKYSFYQIANETAYKIFQTQQIVRTVARTSVSGYDWPFVKDRSGEKMVEEIAEYLGYSQEQKLTRQRFRSLQLSALSGAEAIAAILDMQQPDDADLEIMAKKCFNWRKELNSLPNYQGDEIGQRLMTAPRLLSVNSH